MPGLVHLLSVCQSVSLSTETLLHILSLVGALAAIFVRIGKFETKHDMSLSYMSKEIVRIETGIRDMIRTELDRMEKSIAKLDSEAENLRSHTSKYVAIETKQAEHERRISAIENKIEGRDRSS